MKNNIKDRSFFSSCGDLKAESIPQCGLLKFKGSYDGYERLFDNQGYEKIPYQSIGTFIVCITEEMTHGSRAGLGFIQEINRLEMRSLLKFYELVENKTDVASVKDEIVDNELVCEKIYLECTNLVETVDKFKVQQFFKQKGGFGEIFLESLSYLRPLDYNVIEDIKAWLRAIAEGEERVYYNIHPSIYKRLKSIDKKFGIDLLDSIVDIILDAPRDKLSYSYKGLFGDEEVDDVGDKFLEAVLSLGDLDEIPDIDLFNSDKSILKGLLSIGLQELVDEVSKKGKLSRKMSLKIILLRALQELKLQNKLKKMVYGDLIDYPIPPTTLISQQGIPGEFGVNTLPVSLYKESEYKPDILTNKNFMIHEGSLNKNFYGLINSSPLRYVFGGFIFPIKDGKQILINPDIKDLKLFFNRETQYSLLPSLPPFYSHHSKIIELCDGSHFYVFWNNKKNCFYIDSIVPDILREGKVLKGKYIEIEVGDWFSYLCYDEYWKAFYRGYSILNQVLSMAIEGNNVEISCPFCNKNNIKAEIIGHSGKTKKACPDPKVCSRDIQRIKEVTEDFCSVKTSSEKEEKLKRLRGLRK